jgi:inhibitor of KinA
MNTDCKINFKIFPLGENALTIEFGNSISLELNRRVFNLAEYFEKNPFPGLIETVPAYASLTFFYDVYVVKHSFINFPTVFETVKNLVENAILKVSESNAANNRLVEIPVNFAKEFALDLEFVAEINHLTCEQVIKIFTAQTFQVFMLGFLPGFAYLGEIDEKIAAPRKETPRTKVPKGSVGIAGRQTGIYPLESPGGWQIIGKTDLKMFEPKAENPCILQVGDSVKFYEHSS